MHSYNTWEGYGLFLEGRSREVPEGQYRIHSEDTRRQSPRAKAKLIADRGLDELVLRHYEKALEHFLVAVRLSPALKRDAYFLTRVAVCYNELAQPTDAIGAAEQALELLAGKGEVPPAGQPGLARALGEAAQGYLSLYTASQDRRQLKKAKSLADEAHNLCPRDLRVATLYGKLQALLRDLPTPRRRRVNPSQEGASPPDVPPPPQGL